MAYIKTVWENGDVITKEKLNNIEDGIANAGGGGSPMKSTTYAELLAMRNAGTLTPGMQYRITDYVCTTTQEESRAVSHPFDVIVVADDASTLNENARACLHEGDTYYTAENRSANLEAWELKYCIDNDRNRFGWADATNGKGVIFWMKDERGNECSYDFKQIQFKRYKITECTVQSLVGMFTTLEHAAAITAIDETNPVWLYTFSVYDSNADTPTYEDGSVAVMDETTGCMVYGNVIECYQNNVEETGPYIYCLNNIVLANSFECFCYNNTFDYNCYNNTFDYNCYNNTFSIACNTNTFGDNCYNNTFSIACNTNTFGDGCCNNTFGDNCRNNTFGDNCYNNIFGDKCRNNTFSDGCFRNIFGVNCYENVFGKNCSANIFSIECEGNIFGNYCNCNIFENDCSGSTFGDGCCNNVFGVGCGSNIFDHDCSDNTFSDGCFSNVFGYDCRNNTLGNACYNNTFGNHCSINIFEIMCIFINIPAEAQEEEDPVVSKQFYHILSGTSGTESAPLTIPGTGGNNYVTYVGLNSSGELKTWVPADLVTSP